MIRVNVTDVHMSIKEATALADLMEENGYTSMSAALDCAVGNAANKVGASASIGLVVDSMVSS